MRQKRKILMAFAVLILLPVCAFATDITFTSSGSIVDGNIFANVYVENNGTVVNMSGGQISRLVTYDYSIFNMSGGQIIYGGPGISINSLSTINVFSGTIDTSDFVIYGSADFSGGNITADRLKTYSASAIAPASVVNITGGNLNFRTFDIRGILNIYRGLLYVSDLFSFHDSAAINIWGSNFNYNNGILSGYLLDNNFFTIKGVSQSEYTRFNLIPEPISILLFGFGLLALRKQKK